MANRYLHYLYKRLFDEPFSYGDFTKRLKMQKGIYLLQEMGVPVGDYRFTWYKHGPYSQSLLDDMYITTSTSDYSLNTDAEMAVNKLADALDVPKTSKYNSEDWAECLGSLHYLKEKVLYTSDDAFVIQELQRRKPHLDDTEANYEALSRLRHLTS